MEHFDFHLPTRILFGRGRLGELRANLPRQVRRVLVVTDPGVARTSGLLPRVAEQLSGLDVEVLNDVEPNPSLATVERGAAFARTAGSDLLLGIGGGSPMDAAKGIALLATNGGRITDYLDGADLKSEPLPVVCLPTTSGTGSEVTPFAVFSDSEDRSKRGYADPKIFPRFSIIDPELTFTMPPAVTVDTGLDALTHAIEADLSTLATPLSDLLAWQVVEVVRDRLALAAEGHPAARGDLSYAALLAGMAITHAGTILLHVMGYPLTVFHGLPHGRANAALLPAFLAFMQRRSRVPEKVARIEAAFEPCGGVSAFVEGLGVSTNLATYGVLPDEIDTFVAKCVVKDDLRITPADVHPGDIRGIYAEALGG